MFGFYIILEIYRFFVRSRKIFFCCVSVLKYVRISKKISDVERTKKIDFDKVCKSAQTTKNHEPSQNLHNIT